MFTSSNQSLSYSLTPTLHSPSTCGPGGQQRVHSSLSLPEPEPWRKPPPAGRPNLSQGSRSCSLQVPHGDFPELPTRAASFDLPRAGADDSDRGSGSPSPHGVLRRRGGLVEQRDIIMAHQAHKMQITPQARRKEWE